MRLSGVWQMATALVVASALASTAQAQELGTVQGTVSRAGAQGWALAGVQVQVRGTGLKAVTNPAGYYIIRRVPAGEHVIEFRSLGYAPAEAPVTVTAGGTAEVNAIMDATPVDLGDIVVTGASKAPERVVEAPAAVAVIEPQVLQATSVTAQPGLAIGTLPSVDVVQSGINDWNINTRGFNSSLNRRILVLQDGRDLAIAFLGSQEWNALSLPLEDVASIDMVRGPGSALYGANAFNGVLDIKTATAREIQGTKISVGGGELSTIQADLRHAGLLGEGRFGYKANIGFSQSESWAKSRTSADGLDLAREYAEATDDPIGPRTPEAIPLKGQTLDPVTRAAVGEPDKLQSIYGSARLDYYRDDGSVLSLDGGAAQVQNGMFVTGIGRVQIQKAIRPWARLGWAADRFNLMAWYSGRNSTEPQKSLASGIDIDETSAIFHVEGQGNARFADDRGRFVLGGSYRNYNIDTKGTLVNPVNDDRSDDYYSVFSQLDFNITPTFKAVAALRWDDGTLFNSQWSPKGGLVFSPSRDHTFRATVSQAFQTPNYSEFFLQAPAGAPVDLTALEAGLRMSPLGPALAGVPVGELFGGNGGTSDMVPVLALGNDALDVERVTGYEAGYKGQLGRLFLSTDVYYNQLSNFVTDLLPGVNPAYPYWTAPPQVPASATGPLVQAVQSALAQVNPVAAAGFTRVDGRTAVVVSYANAGEVDEWGVELAAGYNLTDEWQVSGSYTLFDFDVKDQAVGDVLLPNTPKNKATAELSYRGDFGLEASIQGRFIEAYQWAAGVFFGRVPASQTINLTAGYRVNNNFRLNLTVTNIADQKRYHLFGGDVIGRRIAGGVTAVF